MTATIYDPRLFALRRVVRMEAHAGPATTRQAEQLALREYQAGHSVANALSSATRYLRSLRHDVPKGAA